MVAQASFTDKQREKIIKISFLVFIATIIISILAMNFCESAEICRKAQPWDVAKIECTEEELAATGGCSRTLGPICEVSKSGCYKAMSAYPALISGFIILLFFGYKKTRSLFSSWYTKKYLDISFVIGLVLMGAAVIISLFQIISIYP